MMVSSVSVLICTFNRASRLGETLECFATAPLPHTYSADVIVVDNNSTDHTRAVVEAAARRSTIPIRYAFENRQGKSFALNTGLELTRADVVALTDDDVIPDEDWLDRIVETFRENDPVFVGGKVLPLWKAPPPPALLTRRAQDIWGPLALVDYGDEVIDYLPQYAMQRRPIGANVAFRRSALVTVGGWRTDLGKVNNTLISGEDHEIFFRLKRASLYHGIYNPRVVVHHDVPTARLQRNYFRRWFFANGQARAIMAADLYPEIDFTRVPRVAGIPRFLFRQLASEAVRWTRNRIAPNRLERVIQELQLIRLCGLMWQSRLAGWRKRSVSTSR